MKKISFIILNTFFLVVLNSCQKVSLSNKNTNISATDLSEKAAIRTTFFGALIADKKDTSSNTFKISVLKNLNSSYTRNTIIMDNWTGRNFDYEKYVENGIETFLNLNNSVAKKKSPPPFVTDTVAYKIKMDEILNEYSPPIIAIENEEGNFEKHEGSMQQYINQLTAAMSVIHKHNLKGTNGGFSSNPITFLVYRYYFNRGEFDKAADFADRCIDPKFWNKLSHPGLKPGFEESISKWDSLMQAYRTVPIDYVNIHFYEAIRYRGSVNATELCKNIKSITPGALQEICDYIYDVTGKKTVSNEMGTLNTQPALVTSMMNECINVNMDYCIWFSGDWGPDNSFALHNADGSIKPSGRAFRDFIISHPH